MKGSSGVLVGVTLTLKLYREWFGSFFGLSARCVKFSVGVVVFTWWALCLCRESGRLWLHWSLRVLFSCGSSGVTQLTLSALMTHVRSE